jgi:hypothetical protein
MDDHTQAGQEGEDGHNASTGPRPTGSPEADRHEQGNQGEDCENNGTKGEDAHETDDPETDPPEGPEAETSGPTTVATAAVTAATPHPRRGARTPTTTKPPPEASVG